MRVRLVNRNEIRTDHEVIWGSIGTTLGLAGLVLPIGSVRLACVFKTITGLPCLTCGMTRSWLRLKQFDVVGAFAFNPAVTAFCIFGALYCAYAVAAVLLRTRRVRIEVTRPWEPTAIRIGAVSLLVINWLYLVAVGR